MKRVSIIVLVLSICTILFVGCSSTTSTTTSAAIAPTAATTVVASTSAAVSTSVVTSVPSTRATSASAEPQYGGTLNFVYWTGPKTPGGIPWELFANELLAPAMCFEPLLHMGATGEIIPWLAESYTVADDLKSISFSLRKNVKFVDGTDFNATAAKWNLDKNIEAKLRPMWASVDVLDDYTIRLNLNYWDNTALVGFDSTYSWMMSPTAYAKNGADWCRENPVGTGPFKFNSFEKDVSYKVVRNPGYWQKGKPYLDGINIIFAADTTLLRTIMQAGQADVCEVEPGKTASDFKNLGFDVEMLMTSVHCLVPDTAHADSPFANLKVREAVEYAINRESIAKAFSYGFWSAPYQIPAADNPAFQKNYTLGRKYNPEKAKALIKEAGYADGFKATLEVIPVGYDRNIPMAVLADLTAVGIKIEINIPSIIPKFMEDSNTAKNVLLLQPIFGGTNFASALQFSLNPVITPASLNLIWERTPEYAALLQKALSAPKMDVALLQACNDYLIQQASIIPVLSGGSGYAHTHKVKNAGWYTRGVDWCPEDTWLDK
jgi:peptide/nickel transport system substrate-binding protein